MRIPIMHPILVAVYPVVYLYAHNSNDLRIDALWLPLGLAVGLASITWIILALLQRDRDRAALMAAFFILFFFSYGHLLNIVPLLKLWPFAFAIVWVVLLAGGWVMLARARYSARRVSEGVNVASIFVLLLSITTIARIAWTRVEQIATQPDCTVPVAREVPLEQRPNIYYIILDMYTNPDAIHRYLGHDVSDFVSYLRRRGFYVPIPSYSNYSQTITSIPSSMNFSYLDIIARAQGARTSDRFPLAELLGNCRVTRVLKHYGYRIVAFPSEYEPITIPSDVNIHAARGFSDFQVAIFNTTPLRLCASYRQPSFDSFHRHRNMLNWQFEQIPATAALEGPFFVFAHILAPHPPVVFDAQGRPIIQNPVLIGTDEVIDDAQESRKKKQEMYCGEVTYLNTRIEQMVDRILTNAKRPTVIVLQGDHGPDFPLKVQGRAAKKNYPLRFAILNAYYFPGDRPAALYPGITPVNTFRLILNHCLGAKLPLLPDEHYYSSFGMPYDFTKVTEDELTTSR